ncbi:MAG: glycosyltransferase [Proteobacteria bacterium]|nr:glycosyltransferase [Pseudomonadota bacterium]
MSKADLHLHSRHSDRPSEWILRKLGIPDSLSDPRKLYETLRAAGHDFVTLTDHNTLGAARELRGLDGFIPGMEITTYFPEDHCKVHLLAWNLKEAEAGEVERLRPNLYELAKFLREEGIVHAVAHPLLHLDGKMKPEHFEKLILLFQVFERVNGLRAPLGQEVAYACCSALTEEKIRQLAEQHGLEPVGRTPWRKAWMGGSNDHCGLYAGQVWTEVAGAKDAETFLRGVERGEAIVHGQAGDPARLVNGLFHVIFDYLRNKVGNRAPRGSDLLLRIANRFLAGENPLEISFVDKARYALEMVTSGKILEFWKSPEGGLSKELSAYLSQSSTREQLQKVLESEQVPERRSFRLASKVMNDVGFRIVTRFIDKVEKGDFLGGLEPLAGVLPLGLATAPYLHSFHALRSDRKLWGQVTERFLGERPKNLKNHRKAWFTDTLEDVNGVARTIRTMAKAGRESGADITILTSRPGFSPEPGVMNFQPVGVFTIPEYDLQKLSFPPILEVIDHIAQRGYTELILSTPGPMGLAGLMAANVLGLRTSAIYHTDFPQYARFLSEDDPMVEGIAWNYMHWFYSQMDRVYVNSQSYLDRWVERGLPREKLGILPRGLETELFSTRHRKENFWKSRGATGKVALYVGRVSKEKELDFLARVADKMPPSAGVTFAFVGEGPFLGELKRKLPQGIFTGVLHGEELGQAYASADLFVFPSTTDTYGNVVVEAMASGLPVVVSNQGGPAELLRDPQDGEKVMAGDLANWSAAIQRVAGRENGPEERTKRRERTVAGRSWHDAFQTFWRDALL